MLATSRKEAIAKGQSYYLSDKPCKKGHIAKKHIDAGCYQCTRNAVVKFDIKNPGKRLRKNNNSAKIWSLKNPEKIKKLQNNCCAICQSDIPGGKGDFHVDHCHKTNKIRGLLCHWCNIALGNFRDSKEYLLRAIKYLEKNS